MTTRPTPPPEAVLIRLVREAAGLKMPAAAKIAGISVARWSQVENGYETHLGKTKPVRARAGTLARMASAIPGLTPERLEAEGQRPDAAAILAEMRHAPQPRDRHGIVAVPDAPAGDGYGDVESAGRALGEMLADPTLSEEVKMGALMLSKRIRENEQRQRNA